MQVQTVLTSPLKRAQATAQTVSRLQCLAGSPQPKVQVMEELTNRYLGGWEGRHALEVRANTPIFAFRKGHHATDTEQNTQHFL